MIAAPASLSLSPCPSHQVLLTVCKVMAPFTPFFTEAMYANLRRVLPQQRAASTGAGAGAGSEAKASAASETAGGAGSDAAEEMEAAEESVHFCPFPQSSEPVSLLFWFVTTGSPTLTDHSFCCLSPDRRGRRHAELVMGLHEESCSAELSLPFLLQD